VAALLSGGGGRKVRELVGIAACVDVLEIGTGAEEAFHAGEHDHTDALVTREPERGASQLAGGLHIERVGARRPH